MRFLILFLFICFGWSVSFGQTKVTGYVKDVKGAPVPFASITLPKTKISTRATETGYFEITLPKGEKRLVVAAVGYEKKEVFIDSPKHLIISLSLIVSTLEEVVVTGYAPTKRKNSVSSSTATYYKSDDLVGKASGLMIAPSAGTEVKIRGVSSLTSTLKKGEVSTTVPVVNPAKAELLTASEVNDFTKWTLWNNYNQNDFSGFSKQYLLSQTKRISVQLMNFSNQAVVAKKIELVTANDKKVVWQAKTDNTGKAELWADSITQGNEATYQILVDGKYTDVHFFDKGVNIIKTDAVCNINDAVDIAFIVDATGSMGDEIAYLKSEVQDIAGQIKSQHPNTQFKFGSVFFRDYSDDYLTRELNFTDDVKALNTFINGQHAGGGGDYPEAVKSGLEVALEKLSWNENAKAKIAFLILDAPPHDREIEDYKKLMQAYAAKGIRVVPVVCSGAQKNVEFLMRSIALATNGTYAFLTDDSGIGDKHMKPTTDNFTVTTLNQLMVRIINGMIYTEPCLAPTKLVENPFTQKTDTEGKDKVYPNPTNGPCTLKTALEIKAMYIADFNGKILQKINAVEKRNKFELDLTIFAAGTYIIVYQDINGLTKMQKVVKL